MADAKIEIKRQTKSGLLIVGFGEVGLNHDGESIDGTINFPHGEEIIMGTKLSGRYQDKLLIFSPNYQREGEDLIYILDQEPLDPIQESGKLYRGRVAQLPIELTKELGHCSYNVKNYLSDLMFWGISSDRLVNPCSAEVKIHESYIPK